ncbi:TetR/AcrR family transcriptional regulator [Streptosporangium sandarakinum]|uniref:TetR/AcrR family transcriptional regulator n=1 Tax=Streptosporangium sandarakinum TaxID=1260955 RepID=UPI00343AB094
MPKQVDHEQRRRQIAEAVWRIACTRGLEDVSLRQVAAEAGVSMRLVQYYFGTRDNLLLLSLRLLNDAAERRAEERVRATTDPSDLRAVLRAVIAEMLPLDEDRRITTLVHLAYFVRSLNDERLSVLFRDAPPALEELMATLIRQAQERGEVPDRVDPRREADLLMTMVDGLQSGMLLGRRTAGETMELLDHQLDRIFTLPSGAQD